MEKHLDRSLAGEWEQHRAHLFGVAYRLLGTVDEAEDVVQEAYLRAARAGTDDVADARAWLTTIASRPALGVLRSARVRREEYVGPWLPEPLVGAIATDDPIRDVELAESVQMAMLLVMERLRPAERVAFVLHDVFGMPFDQVANVLGRSAAACRQLASRARRRLEGSAVISEAGRVLAIDVVLNPQKLDHLRSMWTAQR